MNGTNTSDNRPVIDLPYLDFLTDIYDVHEQIEGFGVFDERPSDDPAIEKISEQIKCIFKNDDILVALNTRLESGELPNNEVMSYRRAIQAQETVLMDINHSRLVF
jgi:hypothetical protein